MPPPTELASLLYAPTALALEQHTRPGQRVLEVGCGPGQNALAVKGRYVGVDLSADPYAPGLSRRVQALADANALAFGRGVFDIVFYANTFYHFTNAPLSLAQAAWVLKPGGRLLLFDYSWRELLRLKASYDQSGQGWQCVPRRSAHWRELLQGLGWGQVTVRHNTFSRKAHWLRRLAPRPLYEAWLDHQYCPILVSAVAPAVGGRL